jgi:hypothetical protein
MWPTSWTMLNSGFHRFSLLFAVGCVGGWFYVLDAWWGLLPALLLGVPIGLLFSVIPSAVVGTLRPILGDILTTWGFVAAGSALGVYALAALDGVGLALVGLCAAGTLFGGASLFYLRLNAVRRRISTAD